MIHGLYRGLTTLGTPLVNLYLRRRLKRGKEDRQRFAERLGRSRRPRPDGLLVWIHAASVGESLSVLPLVQQLLRQWAGWQVLLTTGTVTSARLMDERLPAGAFHQYVPADCPSWVNSFLDHWKPDMALWLESELWPNLIDEAHRRAIPMALLNGRMSAASQTSWQRAPSLIRDLLCSFDLCFAQSHGDADRLVQLGASRVLTPGNLKMASPPLPVDEEALETLRQQIGGRPFWLAASTHEGEELAAWEVHQQLRRQFPDLLTVVAPRHPGRGTDIASALQAMGANVARRSAGDAITAETTVYLADTLGELGTFYRLCPLVFIGKSLDCPAHGGGGQNPLEAARLGAAVIFGPLMDNFAEVAPQMVMAGAASQVQDVVALAEMVAALLHDPQCRVAIGQKGAEFASTAADVVERVLEALGPLRERAEDRAWGRGSPAEGQAGSFGTRPLS